MPTFPPSEINRVATAELMSFSRANVVRDLHAAVGNAAHVAGIRAGTVVNVHNNAHVTTIINHITRTPGGLGM